MLDAPTLYRSAKAAPLGARRTVAIDILRPVDAVSSALGLAHVVGAADRVMGRTGKGVVQVQLGPALRHSSGPKSRHATAPLTARSSAYSFGNLRAGQLSPWPAPTASDPLRVLSVGDSLGVDFGQAFVNDLAATGIVDAVLDARVDTGLTRPDYFNWQQELYGDLAKYQPQIVVVCLGANDPQNLVDANGAVAYGTAAWNSEYARRVGEFIQAATDFGARVLWVGMPPMADPALNAKMLNLDSIFQDQARRLRGATYFSSWQTLSDPTGSFATFLPDTSGNEVQVREPDGTHISAGGAERLSQAVIAQMDRSWGLRLQP